MLGTILNVTREVKDGNCVIKYSGTLKIHALRFFLLGIDDDKTFFAVLAFRYTIKSATKVCPCKADEKLEPPDEAQQDLFPSNVRVYIEGELSGAFGKYKPTSKDYDTIISELMKIFWGIQPRPIKK